MSCGLSRRSNNPCCANKYAHKPEKQSSPTSKRETAGGELGDDVVVVSDDEPPPCSKKLCKTNPNCLNYLGQETWKDEGEFTDYQRDFLHCMINTHVMNLDKVRELFLKASDLGFNPVLNARDPELPVGLKVEQNIVLSEIVQQVILIYAIQNLGATCYANAFIQVCVFLLHHLELIRISAKVWFRDLAFRNGVYMCQPSQDKEDVFEVSEQMIYDRI
jgi:ubiquitin carboxyl-terminal hydrolase 48